MQQVNASIQIIQLSEHYCCNAWYIKLACSHIWCNGKIHADDFYETVVLSFSNIFEFYAHRSFIGTAKVQFFTSSTIILGHRHDVS